jgi:hypothetical protein
MFVTLVISWYRIDPKQVEAIYTLEGGKDLAEAIPALARGAMIKEMTLPPDGGS